MTKPYPLKFQPEFKERVWGGRALEKFGLELPEGHIGEGWMIADHPNGTSSVVNGELAGLGLDAIREQFGHEWFGSKGITEDGGRFPLLIKLLDCNDNLSVQVHLLMIMPDYPRANWAKQKCGTCWMPSRAPKSSTV